MATDSQIVQWIIELERFGIQLGLERTQKALELLENPQERFQSVLVGGTNGKGSTAAFLSHILQANGYKTGLYTSPHLTDITERFQINQKAIPKKQFEKKAMELRSIIEQNQLQLTQFEFLTVLALDWFASQKTDWAVLEVGLGGRLDATNVVNAQASCITNISLEHQQFLGNSLREIAFEKAGIIKKNQLFATTEKDSMIVQLFSDLATAQKARFLVEGKEFTVQTKKIELEKTVFDFDGLGIHWSDLELALTGEHQTQNAGLALAVLASLKNNSKLRLSETKTRAALAKTVWPGRFEIVSREPFVLIDCCHNPAGMQAFSKTLQTVLPNLKAKWIVGISEGRKPLEMLQPIAPFASEIVLTQAQFHGIAIQNLQKAASELWPSYKINAIPSVKKTVTQTLANAQPSDAVVLAGSIYMLGEALKAPALKRFRKNKK